MSFTSPPENRGAAATMAPDESSSPSTGLETGLIQRDDEGPTPGEARSPSPSSFAVSPFDDRGRRDLGHVGSGDVTMVKFAGVTSVRGEVLRSPASGTPCVHWRLRVVERVNAALQLVHEIASTEDFDVTWAGRQREDAGDEPTAASSAGVKIRVSPDTACIRATPVLHRPGSPGAVAVARQFGFSGQLSVEEVMLRPGDDITAEGLIEPVSNAASGPFRAVERDMELFDAVVCLPGRPALGPVLLPWALGTAAAILGGVGVAAWAARRFDLLPVLERGTAVPAAEIGPIRFQRHSFSHPDQ